MDELQLAQFALAHSTPAGLATALGVDERGARELQKDVAALVDQPYDIVHALAEVAQGHADPLALHALQRTEVKKTETLYTGELEFVPSKLGEEAAWAVRPSYVVAHAICNNAPDLMASFVLTMMGRPYAFRAADQTDVLTELIEAVVFTLQTAHLNGRTPDRTDEAGNDCYKILTGWELRRSASGEVWACLATADQSLTIAWPKQCDMGAPVLVKMVSHLKK